MRGPLLLPLFALPLVLTAQQPRAEEHLERARSAYYAARLEEALAHADSALAADATVPGGYKLRGDIKQRSADLHGALLDYVRAEKQNDQDPRLFVSRSAIHVTEGRVKEAIRDADRALSLDKNDADAWYNRGCANYLGQDMNGALRDLDRSLELNPNNAFALMLRGVVNGALYKDREGLSDLRAALALDPTLPGVRMSLAVQLFEAKQFQEAITVFTEVIDAGGEDALVEAHYYRADCHYNLGDKEQACADWRAAGEGGDKDAQFIVRNYCNTDEEKIPRKPVKQRKTVIEF
ncbi:MAG: tetratricopeptide repeat protein [Flavobacteriales bacterium]